MILRKTINHISGANWPAVLIELLVVIVGVYGAFQLERWGEERRESQREWILLEQLHNEIEVADPIIEAQAQARRKVLNETVQAASILMQPPGSGELDDDQCYQMFRISVLSWDPLTLTTLDEMVSSGAHSQLDDHELRTLLFSLKADMQGFSDYIQLVRPQHNVLMDLYPNLLPRGIDADGESFIHCDTDGMRARQDFINHLMSNIGRYGGFANLLERQLDALRNIHGKLDKVLETSGAEEIALHENITAEDNHE